MKRRDMLRRSATCVDRVLGAKPGDLSVQAPKKCGPVINLKTAKALVLIATDEVIE